MYSLLIVDDEREVVGWLYELFMEARHLELEVYKAYSAKEALNLLEKVKIDIVLSDIRMPGLSGLQLMERIKQTWPKCRVVFLTGYKEFEYVYTAIQNEGVRYLLKTEGDSKILETVQETIQQIEASLQDEEIVNRAKQHMLRMQPLLQREFLNELINGEASMPNDLQKRLGELNIPLNVQTPVIIFIGRFDSSLPSGNLSQKYEYCFALNQIAEEYLTDKLKIVQVINESFDLVWIIQPIMEDHNIDEDAEAIWNRAFTRIKGALEYLQDCCRKTLGITISFAVSDKYFSIYTISEEYTLLKKLFGYRIGLGTEMILSNDNVSLQDHSNTTEEYKVIHGAYKQLGKVSLLVNHLESRRTEEYFSLLDSLIGSLGFIRSKSSIYAYEIYYNVSMALLGYINNNNLAEKIAFRIGIYKLSRADEHSNWGEAVDYLKNISCIIFDVMTDEEEKRAEDIMDKIRQYIDSHLKEDLTLVRLADIFHFNSSYLSRLFKQVSGKNLSDYILTARVEKAKELLEKSTLKVNEISVEVGYESPHSFARFFRNAAGMSPQEYRAFHINK